jgi:hypothetical protein
MLASLLRTSAWAHGNMCRLAIVFFTIASQGFTTMCIQSTRWLLDQSPKGSWPLVFQNMLTVTAPKQLLFAKRMLEIHAQNVQLSKGKSFKRPTSAYLAFYGVATPLPPPRNTGVPNCKLCESLAHFQGSGAPCRVGTDGRGASSCQNPPRENEQTSDVSVSRLPNTSPYSGFLKSHARPLRDKIPHTTFGHHPTVYFGPNSHRPHQANTPHATSNKHPKDHIRPTSHRPFRANLPHTTSSQLPTGHFDSTSTTHIRLTSHRPFRANLPNTTSSQYPTCHFAPKSHRPHQAKLTHARSSPNPIHISPKSHIPFRAKLSHATSCQARTRHLWQSTCVTNITSGTIVVTILNSIVIAVIRTWCVIDLL